MNITKRAVLKGFFDMLPLCLAVVPWGILCGSLAIQNGFSAFETQAMSLLVFAGSAQLVAIELMAGNTPLLTILFTTFIISSRHFLYGLAVRHKVISQPLRWRLPISFVLTDELFAFSHHRKAYKTKARLIYALSAGFSFYIAWKCWLKDHIEEMILKWLCCGYGEQFMTFMEIFGFFENWKEREEDRKLDPYTYGLKPHEQEIVKEIIKTNKTILQEAIKLKWKKLAKKAIRPKHMDEHIENYTQKKHTIIEMTDIPTKTDTPPGTPRRRRRTIEI